MEFEIDGVKKSLFSLYSTDYVDIQTIDYLYDYFAIRLYSYINQKTYDAKMRIYPDEFKYMGITFAKVQLAVDIENELFYSHVTPLYDFLPAYTLPLVKIKMLGALSGIYVMVDSVLNEYRRILERIYDKKIVDFEAILKGLRNENS